jgi:hypothetical protein
MDKVVRDWRKFHSEEFQHLHSTTNIIQVIKSRMMRWARHVASMGEKRCKQNFDKET